MRCRGGKVLPVFCLERLAIVLVFVCLLTDEEDLQTVSSNRRLCMPASMMLRLLYWLAELIRWGRFIGILWLVGLAYSNGLKGN